MSRGKILENGLTVQALKSADVDDDTQIADEEASIHRGFERLKIKRSEIEKDTVSQLLNQAVKILDVMDKRMKASNDQAKQQNTKLDTIGKKLDDVCERMDRVEKAVADEKYWQALIKAGVENVSLGTKNFLSGLKRPLAIMGVGIAGVIVLAVAKCAGVQVDPKSLILAQAVARPVGGGLQADLVAEVDSDEELSPHH